MKSSRGDRDISLAEGLEAGGDMAHSRDSEWTRTSRSIA